MIPELHDLSVDGKTVLVQSNLDVPLDENGAITDDSRLRAGLETIRHLLDRKCAVILAGHIGRPGGQVVPELSTKPVAERLSELLRIDVAHIPDIVGPEAERIMKSTPRPGVAVLENLRFHAGEEAPDMGFAEQLASLADAFVNDDYIDAHRDTSCNVLVPRLLPSCMGPTLKREWECVKKAVEEPARPFVLIIGGAKQDKIGAINHLLGVADHILLGGVLANTFLKASGADMKASRYDERSEEIAGEFLRESEEKFLLPVDAVAAAEFAEDAEHREVPVAEIPDGWMALDIGSQTIERYTSVIAEAKTIVWGGPIGVFEWPAFRRGTEEVAKAVASADAYTLVAGGDSGAAMHALGLAEKVSHVSIGGGATLSLIAGESLPALQALERE